MRPQPTPMPVQQALMPPPVPQLAPWTRQVEPLTVPSTTHLLRARRWTKQPVPPAAGTTTRWALSAAQWTTRPAEQTPRTTTQWAPSAEWVRPRVLVAPTTTRRWVPGLERAPDLTTRP